MFNIDSIIQFFQNPDAFTAAVLFVFLIIYNFFALVLAFQIFTFNRIYTQVAFAPIFRAIAILHVALSFILLLAVVFSL